MVAENLIKLYLNLILNKLHQFIYYTIVSGSLKSWITKQNVQHLQ